MVQEQKKLKPRRITQDMLLSSASLTKSSKETVEKYLSRLTHLHLQNKRIAKIENLDLCSNLKVLYLYQNQIEKIEGLGNQPILYYLYLQENKIKEILNLNMPGLRKLYLDENELELVAGLDVCTILEELHLSKQRLPSPTAFVHFDPISLNAISNTLEVLDITGCGISNLLQFCCLTNLRKFFAVDNNVLILDEAEELMLSTRRIVEVNMKGNPICRAHKYFDILIAAAPDTIKLFDEKDVLPHQQEGIKGLVAMRRAKGMLAHKAEFEL